jgi:hypothetical protein
MMRRRMHAHGARRTERVPEKPGNRLLSPHGRNGSAPNQWVVALPSLGMIDANVEMFH